MDVDDDLLPTQKIGSISNAPSRRWLIENLWLESACGIIGGQPKCCKSWLGLDMAISVASGTPCLGQFPVLETGPALVFMAEDRVEEVRRRVQEITAQRGLLLSDLDLHLITAPSVRLDSDNDQKRLNATIAAITPRLLLLDPLVRLHRLDENSAREISGLLGFLRELERRHRLAIVLTHHVSKKASSRPGQGLRGSGDLHAFGDSNIYLSRKGNKIEIAVEHRSASAIDPFLISLATEPSVHLEIVAAVADGSQNEPDIEDRIIEVLGKASSAISRTHLRESLRVNNQRLGKAINNLVAAATITSNAEGIALTR